MKILSYICLVFCTFLFSCKKENKAYTDSALLEFKEVEIVKTISFAQKGNYTILVPIQIIGPLQSSNTEVTISSSESNTSLVVVPQKVTIPAGSYSTNVEVIVNSDNVTKDKALSLVLEITDASQCKPAKNYNKANLVITKQSFIESFTGSYTAVETSYQNVTYSTTFAKSTDSTIYTFNFLNFASDGYRVTFTLDEKNKNGHISSQNFIDKAGHAYELTGTIEIDETKKMKLSYTLVGDSDKQAGTVEYTPKE